MSWPECLSLSKQLPNAFPNNGKIAARKRFLDLTRTESKSVEAQNNPGGPTAHLRFRSRDDSTGQWERGEARAAPQIRYPHPFPQPRGSQGICQVISAAGGCPDRTPPVGYGLRAVPRTPCLYCRWEIARLSALAQRRAPEQNREQFSLNPESNLLEPDLPCGNPSSALR